MKAFICLVLPVLIFAWLVFTLSSNSLRFYRQADGPYARYVYCYYFTGVGVLAKRFEVRKGCPFLLDVPRKLIKTKKP